MLRQILGEAFDIGSCDWGPEFILPEAGLFGKDNPLFRARPADDLRFDVSGFPSSHAATSF